MKNTLSTTLPARHGFPAPGLTACGFLMLATIAKAADAADATGASLPALAMQGSTPETLAKLLSAGGLVMIPLIALSVLSLIHI